MADVSFNEEPSYASAYAPTVKKSGLTALVIKLGLAQNEKQAQGVLTGTVVLCLLIIGGVFLLARNDTPPAQTPGSESWPAPVAPKYRR